MFGELSHQKAPWRRDWMKVLFVVAHSNLSAFLCTSVIVVRWIDVLLSSGYKIGVSIWDAVHSHSMDRWVLSGADVMASFDSVVEPVWLLCDEALGCWMPAGVGRFPQASSHSSQGVFDGRFNEAGVSTGHQDRSTVICCWMEQG